MNVFNFVCLKIFFKINLIAYELEGSVAKLVQRSWELNFESIKLNVWKNHLSLIADLNIIVAYTNAFIVISYGIVTVIIINILKLVKPPFMIFFQEVFIKAHPQYLKNLRNRYLCPSKHYIFSLFCLL